MNIGDTIYFVDLGRQGSLTAPTLPLSLYSGRISSTGTTYIAVLAAIGIVCFDRHTGISQNHDYKMMESRSAARHIIKQRENRRNALKRQ